MRLGVGRLADERCGAPKYRGLSTMRFALRSRGQFEGLGGRSLFDPAADPSSIQHQRSPVHSGSLPESFRFVVEPK